MAISPDVLARFAASQEAEARPAPSGPAEWLRSVLPVAEAVAEEYGLPVEGVLAQAALESGYGKHAPGNNLFGIKSHGKGGQAQRTQEFIDGRMQTVTDSFRDYGDVGESFRDYGEFIHRNPRYRSALGQADPEAYVSEIARAGYATDPAYADKLVSIIRGPAMREALGDRAPRPARSGPQTGIPADVLERFRASQAQPQPPEDPYLALLRARQANVEPVDEDSQITKGFKAGGLQLKGLAQGLGALASDFAGQDAWRDSLLSDYQATMARAAEHAGRTMDIFEAESAGDVLDWAAYWAGNLAPMMASSIVSGGFGAFAARKLATGAVERALVRKTAELTAQGIGKEAAKKQALEFASRELTKATARGAVAGSATASVGLESASIYGDIYEQTGELRPGTAVAFGLPAGLLDVVPELGIIGRLAGNANADGIIKSLFKQAGKEGATEAGQTAIERSAVQSVDPSLEAFSGEGIREIANAAAVGLLGGSLAGAATRPFSGSLEQSATGPQAEAAPEIQGEARESLLDQDAVAQPEAAPGPEVGLSDAEISAARSRLDAERGTQMVSVPERRGFREAPRFRGGLLGGPPEATIIEGEVLPTPALEGPRPVSPYFGDDQLNQLIHAERPAGLLTRQRFQLASPTPSLPAPAEPDTTTPPPPGPRTLRPFSRRNLASGLPGEEQAPYGAPPGLPERPELTRPTAQTSPEIAQAQAERAAAERRAIEEDLAYLQAQRPQNPAIAQQMAQARERLAEAKEAERIAEREARTLRQGVAGEGRRPPTPEGLPYGSRLYRPTPAPEPQGGIVAPAREPGRPQPGAAESIQAQREAERFRRIQADGARTESDRAFARDYARRNQRPDVALEVPEAGEPQRRRLGAGAAGYERPYPIQPAGLTEPSGLSRPGRPSTPQPQPQETSDEAQAQAQAQAQAVLSDITKANGKPFPTRKSAQAKLRSLAKAGDTQSYDIAEVEAGGFVLRPQAGEPQAPAPRPPEAVEQAEAPAPPVAPKKAPAKPKKSPGKRFAEAGQVRPEDTIITAIARLGGLDRTEAEAQGIDPAHFGLRPVFGRPAFRKAGGSSFDGMAERLSQHGYFEGEYGANALLDKVDQELRGTPVRTPRGAELAAEREAQEIEAEAESDVLDPLAISAEDLEASGYNDLEGETDRAIADLRDSANAVLGFEQARDIAEDVATRFGEASDAEYIDALRSAYDDAIARQTEEGAAGGAQDDRATAQDRDGDEAPLLATYDESELAAREDEVAAAAARREAQRTADAERAQADREREDFTLTGSARRSDANPGQADLIDATGRPRHSQRARATTRSQTRGVSRRVVDQVVMEFQQQFRKGASDLRFRIYDKQADVRWLHDLEPGTRVKASVSSTGIVSLIAENLDSKADVYAQIRHEVIAHVGLPRLLGEARWNEILDDVAAAEGRDEIMSAVYAEVRGDYPELSGRPLADEVLARIAERTQAPVGAFREILAKIIRFLRKAGFWTRPMSVSDARALLTESSRNLRRTPPRGPGGRFMGRGQRQALAWHGTAADFERFDLHQINTGEGNQQFGWGMYFASNRAVAEYYRDKLKTPGTPGRLYKVDIAPKHDDYINWDVFLADLAPETQARLERLIREEDISGPGLNQLGQVFYQRLQSGGRGPEGASRLLAEYGIPGIAYLDQGSRDNFDGEGTGTYNYVVFDDRMVSILDRFSKRAAAGTAPRADLDAGQRRNVGEFFSDLSADTRKHWFGTLTRQQVVDIASDVLPEAKDWERTAQRMDADKTAHMVGAGETAQRWGDLTRKHPAVAARLADIMHEATVAGIDPSKPKAPDADAPTYNALSNRYETTLNDEARDLFNEVRDAYEKRWKETHAAMKARVERSGADGEGKRAMLTKLRIHFESSRVKGPYFPLARFGDYWVRLTKQDAEPEFAMFETSAEQREFMRSARVRGLEGKGWKVDSGKSLKSLKAASGPSAAFVSDLHEVVDGVAEGDQARAIKDGIYQLYLESLPELSVRKHAMHRSNRKGFSRDALRAFASQMWHGSNQLARLKHGDVLADGLASMRESAKGLDSREARNKAADVVKELDSRLDWMMNPQSATWASDLTSLGFVYYLGVSPAAALVNLTQTAIVALPVLASRAWGGKPIGAARAGRALTAGLRDYTASRFNDAARKRLESENGGDMGRALSEAESSGVLERTLAHSLAGLSETEASIYREGRAKAMGIVAKLFHESERANREAGFIAGYRLARQSGQSHAQAVESASDFVLESHFDYSSANRARFMQGNAARVLLLFRQYSQNMTYLLWRNFYQATKGEKPEIRAEARTKLFGVLGMTGVFAGAAGLPLMGMVYTVSNLAAAAFGDDDDPWDAELAWRQFLAENLPEGWGDVAAKGPVNALTGLDLSSRTSLAELWVRSPYRELEGKALVGYWLEQAAGPVAGIAMNLARGAELYGEGKPWRAVETAVPKFAKDAMKAYRYSQEGALNLKGDPVLERSALGPWNQLWQASGLSPAELNERYDQNSALKKLEGRIKDRRRSLINAWVMARTEGDRDGMDQAREAIRRFNRTNRTVAITGETLARSLAGRARASQESREGTRFDRRLRQRIEGEAYLDV